MPTPDKAYPAQHIGGTVLVVMMDVDPAHEDEFNRWYNDEHLPERLEIPGYVSARRFKLEEGEGVLRSSASGSLRTAALSAVRPIKPSNNAPASYVTASIHTLPSECARPL